MTTTRPEGRTDPTGPGQRREVRYVVHPRPSLERCNYCDRLAPRSRGYLVWDSVWDADLDDYVHPLVFVCQGCYGEGYRGLECRSMDYLGPGTYSLAEAVWT